MLLLTLCPSFVLPQGKKATAVNQDGNCVVGINEAGQLKQQVEDLVPAFIRGDLIYPSTFLKTYRAFASPHQVLDILFSR